MSMQRSSRKHQRSRRTFPRCGKKSRTQSARLNRASASRRRQTKNSARSAAAKASPQWQLRLWSKHGPSVMSSGVEESRDVSTSLGLTKEKMPIRLFNTYPRKLEEFRARDPNSGKTDIYTCGPTVYS